MMMSKGDVALEARMMWKNVAKDCGEGEMWTRRKRGRERKKRKKKPAYVGTRQTRFFGEGKGSESRLRNCLPA